MSADSRPIILNVNDEPSALYVKTRILREAGFEVREAKTGEEALVQIETDAPDLVLLDVKLPDISGIEVCRRIKAARETATLPVVQISAVFRDEPQRILGLDSGADMYLAEPVGPELLVSTLRALLRFRYGHENARRDAEHARVDAELVADRLRRLHAISTALSEAVTTEDVLDTIADRMMAATGAATGYVAIVNEDGTELAGARIRGYPEKSAAQLRRVPIDSSLPVADAIRTGAGVFVEDPADNPRYRFIAELEADVPARATAAVPLAGQGRMLGALGLRFSTRKVFDEDYREFLTTIGRECGQALERARLYDAERQLRQELEQEMAVRKRTEEQYRTLAENAPEIIARFDSGFRHIYINDYGAKVYGIPKPRIIGRTSADLGLSPDKAAFWKQHLEEVFATGKQHIVGFEFDSPAIGHKFFSSLFVPETDAGGRVTSVVAITRDITEQKQADEALRDSEAQFRTLANAIPQLCWMAHADGWFFWYNQRWYEYTGTTPEQMEGWGWQSVHDSEALPRVLERWKSSIATGQPFDMVFPLRGADGVFRPFLTRIVPVRDHTGEITRWFGTSTDISDQRRSEEELKQSETRERARAAELEALVEAVPMAIFIARDPECRHMTGNRLAYELLRATPGRNLSKSAPGSDTDTPFKVMKDGREIPQHELPMQKAASTGRPLRNWEFELAFGDGTSRYLLGDAVPLFGEDGRPRGAIGAFIEISDRKRAEERLLQSQKLESIGVLAGGIAHDFNNLLTGILGNASLVLQDADPASAGRIKEVMNSAERAANLTRQLLAYSGKGQFVVRELDVSRAVSEMGDLMQFSIPKSVDLVLNLQRRLPVLRMDPSQLEQIVLNLVINAGEAIGEGNPGKITVAASMIGITEPFVDAIGQDIPAGRYISIEVTDTGSGIDDEKLSKIFDPFFTTKFTGRGLGLAAVSGIVRSQNGAITVRSVPGEGSTFRVLFHPADLGAEKQPRQPEPFWRGTILVVEDESSVREFIGAVLRHEGYRALEAIDGRDALAIFDQEQDEIDGVVLDVVMPVMGANELLPELKSRRPKLAILLTSGYSESEARRLCAAYPDAAFIQKPYTARQIAKAIENALGAQKAA